MSLVVFDSLSLGFGQKTIVADLNLRIGASDRIGLIGPNGSGKTSLLRMLAGQQSYDKGSLRFARGVRVGYLAQDLVVEGGQTLANFVVNSVPGRAELDARLAETEAALHEAQAGLEAALAAGGDGEAEQERLMELAERLADVHERVAHFDAHFTEHEALRILAGLGFVAADSARDLGEFSGGWKMRAVLAALLFQQPDLLLLDEPTNHLDLPSVAWFAAYLKRYQRAFVLVSHDREFLNEQIGRVVSFEPEGVRQFSGNYEGYLKQRAEEEVLLENRAKNLAREREKTEQFIERFRAQATKAAAVQSRVKALEKMEEVKTFTRRQVMRFEFPPCDRAGDVVLRVEGLRKAYGDHVVLADVDLTVRRGEKIGIIGVNGAGKTTLLRAIAGELPIEAGTISFGNRVKVGYYAQHHADTLRPDRTLFEEVAAEDPAAGQTRVRSILGAFLFSGDDVDKKVRVLSGGERARVALARLIVRPGNVMLMDEPTNHLDLDSSESLAESLKSYDGTLLFVSHNRSFVRKLATRIWDVSGGKVETYPGTLDEYMDSCRRRRDGEPEAGVKGEKALQAARPTHVQVVAGKGKPAAVVVAEAPKQKDRRREAELRNERNKVLGPLRKKVAEMEARIAGLEAAQKQRSAQLADPATYADDKLRASLLNGYQKDADTLEDLTRRWEIGVAELEQVEAELAAG
ncbi:MAG: ABC-F family ATP-binding cassette domain-containing protein [Nannocystis sp.]|uniref:ABC-F family ATP-binding cassette domain-containing protein n=1 Tax=Nannocystis sp. TaxID=1962667 RepID=UPI0024214E25|nr:ABC-F family ATP-binding cassette domain-containing protein [Nannocystis sp.]MBK9757772.1 ABC-F family ATP-binding cassette domain-containing protein [Nannocystis sp.]